MKIEQAYSAASLSVLDLRIQSNRIHYLKFILEGYDGLAMLSTLDPRQGIIRLRFSEAAREEILALLRDLELEEGVIGHREDHDFKHEP